MRFANLAAVAAVVSWLAGCQGPDAPAPVGATLAGRATLAGERDHSGVLVSLAGPVGRATITDADGTYDFEGLPPGAYQVSASAPDTLEAVVSATATISAGETAGPELVLTPIGEVAGVVTPPSAGAGAGASAVVRGASFHAGTDEAGAWLLQAVPTGVHAVILSRPGSVSATVEGVEVRRGQRTIVAEVALQAAQATGAVRGEVTVTGAAEAAGVAVTLAGPVTAAGLTGATGAYAFDGLPDGTYTMVMAAPSTAEGTRSASVTVEAGGVSAAPAVAFTGLGSLQGRVSLAGAAGGAPGALVRVDGTQLLGVTSADGSFALTGVPAGPRHVSVSLPGQVTELRAVQVTWGAVADVGEVALQPVVPTGSLVGTVQVAGATSAEGVVVTLAGPVWATTTTGPDGAYEFRALPDGRYTLLAVATSTVEGTQGGEITVAGGSTTVAPPLSFTGVGRVAGQVLRAGDTQGSAGTLVRVAGTTLATATDASGSYAIDGVPAGSRQVLLDYPGFVSASLPVEVPWGGEARADLPAMARAVQPWRLVGRVVGQAGQAVPGAFVRLAGPTSWNAITTATGDYAFEGLVDGTYALTATALSTLEASVTVMAQVAGGALTAPDLVLTLVGRLAGQVHLSGQATGNGGTAVALAGTEQVAFTDDTGRFTFSAVPVGTHELLAVRAGYQTVSAGGLVVAWNQFTTAPGLDLVQLELGPGQHATGRLAGFAAVAGPGRLPGITVSVDGTARQASTGPDGAWAIEGIEDGVYDLTFTYGDWSEHVAGVVSLPGGDGFLHDGPLYPLPEIELQRGVRFPPGALIVGVTSDGQLVAKAAGALLSVPLAGGPVRTIATGVNMVHVPAWTAPTASSWLLYGDGSWQLMAVPSTGGASVKLTDGWVSPQLDRAASTFVVAGSDGRIWYAALDRGEVRPVARGRLLSWDPAIGYAGFIDPASSLGSVDLATGAVTMLATDVGYAEPILGGTRLLIRATAYNGPIMVGSPSTPAVQVTTLTSPRVLLSPDQRRIAVETFDPAAAAQLGVLVASTEDGQVLASVPNGYFGTWSADSAHFTVKGYSAPTGFHLGRSSDGALLRVGEQSTSSQLFSPDGRHLAFGDVLAGSNFVKVVETAGGTVVASAAETRAPEGLAFSPDGSRLLYQTGGLYRLPLDGGPLEVLAGTSPFQVQRTTDSRFVAFRGTGGWSAAALDGGPAVPLQVGSSAYLRRLLVPADVALFHELRDGLTVNLAVPLDGGPALDLGSRPGSDPVVSPDGRTATLIDAGGVLRAASLPAGPVTQVAVGVSAAEYLGTKLLVTGLDQSLALAPLAGPAVPVASSTSWHGLAPPGRFVYVDGDRNLVSVSADSGVSVLLATGVTGASTVPPAVRGERVVYGAGGVLWSVPVDGGAPTPQVRQDRFPATLTWIDDRHLTSARTDAAAPLRFQNGLYLVTIP